MAIFIDPETHKWTYAEGKIHRVLIGMCPSNPSPQDSGNSAKEEEERLKKPGEMEGGGLSKQGLPDTAD